jgi:hypothetical protein
MKKLLVFAALVAIVLSFSGCVLYSLSRSCTIKVYVYDRYGSRVPDEMVYLFYSTSVRTKDHSFKSAVTDERGIVDFRISEIEMLYQEENTMYALTFKGNEITGQQVFIARQNKTIDVTIKQIK